MGKTKLSKPPTPRKCAGGCKGMCKMPVISEAEQTDTGGKDPGKKRQKPCVPA